MAIEPFHHRFNLQYGHEDVKGRFVARASNVINEYLGRLNPEERRLATVAVATALGEVWNGTLAIDQYVGDDFMSCLQAIETLNRLALGQGDEDLSESIQGVLHMSERDLGVQWKDDHFVRAGAKLLDDRLVNDNLQWLEETGLKTIHEPFIKGLMHYSESIKQPIKLKDVITDMYEALEATGKLITKRDADLSTTAEQFIAELCLSAEHSRMLREYIAYANRYFRHAANPDRQPLQVSDVEAEHFIYLTGLFIRFAIRKFQHGANDAK